MYGLKESNYYYSDDFKFHVVSEVLSGKITKEEARRQYGIKGKSTVLKWMRKFGVAQGQTKLPSINMSKKLTNKDNEALLKRIKELEEALLDEKIKAEGYSIMIDIAEKEFNIPIRKKLGTKQSKK